MILYKKLIIVAMALILLGFNAVFAEEMQASLETPSLIDTEKKETKNKKHKKKRKKKKDKSAKKSEILIIEMKSDDVFYDKETESFISTGNVEVFVTKENSRLVATKIIYDPNAQLIKAIGDVHIYKNGHDITGEYIDVDLTKENLLISKPELLAFGYIDIKARTGNFHGDTLEFNNGKARIDGKNYVFKLSANMFGSEKSNAQFMAGSDNMEIKRVNRYKINADEVHITREPERQIIKLKKAEINVNERKLCTIPSLAIASDADMSFMEIDGPELGFNSEMGIYGGWGKLFYLPGSATLKVAPVIAAGGSEGGGGTGLITRFASTNNVTEAGYTSNGEKFVMKGDHEFNENVNLVYGHNSYIGDGIIGRKKANLLVDLVREDEYFFNDANLKWYVRNSAGYAEDYDHTKLFTDDELDELEVNKYWGTTRFRTQGDLVNINPLWQMTDNLSVKMRSQYGISLYGSGDRFAILRSGPMFTYSKPDKLHLDATYFISGTYGQSPMEFDRYKYGKSTLEIGTVYTVSDKLDLTYSGAINLRKKGGESTFASNRVHVKYGPDDYKVNLGYDFGKQLAFIGVDVIIGTENTEVNYKKLKLEKKKARKWFWQRD